LQTVGIRKGAHGGGSVVETAALFFDYVNYAPDNSFGNVEYSKSIGTRHVEP
jgi:hypothetical protein